MVPTDMDGWHSGPGEPLGIGQFVSQRSPIQDLHPSRSGILHMIPPTHEAVSWRHSSELFDTPDPAPYEGLRKRSCAI